MKKPTVSPSKMSMFLKCPKQFEANYIEHLPDLPQLIVPLVKGKLTHRALEIMAGQEEHDIHKAVLESINSMEREGYNTQKMAPTVEIISESEKEIKVWYKPEKFQNIIGIEESFTIDDDEVVWTGIIDKKQKFNNIIRITDYKTGGRLYSTEELYNDPQMIIYAWSHLRDHPEDTVEVVIDMVSQNRETVPIQFTYEDVRPKIDYLKEIAIDMYGREVYQPQVGSHCLYCDHQCQTFQRWIDTLPDLTLEPGQIRPVDNLLEYYKELGDKARVLEGKKNQVKEYIISTLQKYGQTSFKAENISVTMTNRTSKHYDTSQVVKVLPPALLSQVLSVDSRKLDKMMSSLPGELRTQLLTAISMKEGSPYIIVR